mgnify:CR=1 FL=1
MIKNIIREIPAENTDFSWYFDGDCYKGTGESFIYNLFILDIDRWNRISGYNTKEYESIIKCAEYVIDGFSGVDDGEVDYDGRKITYKRIMEENNIAYNSTKCSRLKAWAKDADTTDVETIAEFLTITRGEKWNVTSARGCSQGDYVEILYCENGNSEEAAIAAGEIWLGAGKEFSVIDVDENGEETDCCSGYIVADSQAWKDADYKRIVCEWACIKEEETRLEMIDDYSSLGVYEYNYRIV